MNSSGLEWEACFVHVKVLKVKMGGFRLKFVEVCEWFDGCDRLKIIFKSKKNKMTKLSFILKIIKNCDYISLICCRKNINMYNWK